jgi:hypothetical protein
MTNQEFNKNEKLASVVVPNPESSSQEPFMPGRDPSWLQSKDNLLANNNSPEKAVRGTDFFEAVSNPAKYFKPGAVIEINGQEIVLNGKDPYKSIMWLLRNADVGVPDFGDVKVAVAYEKINKLVLTGMATQYNNHPGTDQTASGLTLNYIKDELGRNPAAMQIEFVQALSDKLGYETRHEMLLEGGLDKVVVTERDGEKVKIPLSVRDTGGLGATYEGKIDRLLEGAGQYGRQKSIVTTNTLTIDFGSDSSYDRILDTWQAGFEDMSHVKMEIQLPEGRTFLVKRPLNEQERLTRLVKWVEKYNDPIREKMNKKYHGDN